MRTKYVASTCATVGLLGALSCTMACATDDPVGTSDETFELAPAASTSTGCDVTFTSCSSDVLPANPAHWIDWAVTSGLSGNGCSWRVRDVDSQVVVGSGRVGAFAFKNGRIQGQPGLFGRYRIELFSCLPGGSGGLDNLN